MIEGPRDLLEYFMDYSCILVSLIRGDIIQKMSTFDGNLKLAGT